MNCKALKRTYYAGKTHARGATIYGMHPKHVTLLELTGNVEQMQGQRTAASPPATMPPAESPDPASTADVESGDTGSSKAGGKVKRSRAQKPQTAGDTKGYNRRDQRAEVP